MPSSHTRDSVHLTTDRRIDSTFYFIHDSMSIRFAKGVVPAAQRYTVPSGRYTSEVSSAGGNGIPDTVYVDRWHTIFKDRWHTLSHTDTITVTQHDSIPYPVEVPIEVEKPIPRFYRTCTAGFFLIILCLIWYVFLRIYLRR